MDGGAWKAAVHGVVKSRTQLSDFTFAFHFHALEKEMVRIRKVPLRHGTLENKSDFFKGEREFQALYSKW